MSKIDEMALKAYPVKHKQNKVGAEYDANYPRRAAFVNGAKAVLEEIEDVLHEFNEDDPIFCQYINIVDKINELKQQ